MFLKPKLYSNIILNVYKYTQNVAKPLKSKKPKSNKETVSRNKRILIHSKKIQKFLDFKEVRTTGGKGGDGSISFLSLWSNENAGPDGGDGGNGGHVIFHATSQIRDLSSVPTIAKANDGEKGANKDCHGKNADHLVIKVPIGTIIRNQNGEVIGDLEKEGFMFVAARGGSGGKGNHFFISDTEQSPKICEYGAEGEKLDYTVELKTMAHVGLIGYPNAGKSTLLRAVSRARPKVAPYPFTTLKPHLGMVQYDDYEQVAIADLPGLIPGSHRNKGLGIRFLKHAERCLALLFIIDVSQPQPWDHLHTLQYELSQFSDNLKGRSQLVIANKIDLPNTEENVKALKEYTNLPVIALSAKQGTNILELLTQIRIIYDRNKNTISDL